MASGLVRVKGALIKPGLQGQSSAGVRVLIWNLVEQPNCPSHEHTWSVTG